MHKFQWSRSLLFRSFRAAVIAFCFTGTYTDQPKLSKDEADRVAQAVKTEMDSQNFKTLVTAKKLKAFGLIPELINDRNHVLDLNPILGKTIHALKSMKAISKEYAKAVEKQGIAPPDDPNLAEGSDVEGLNSPGLNPNVTTADFGVAATFFTNEIDVPVRGPPRHLRKRKRNLPLGPKGPKTSWTLSVPSQSHKRSNGLTGSEPIDSIFKGLGTIPEWETSKVAVAGSTRPAPVEAIRSLLSNPDRLDPLVTLRWAMTGELTFGPVEDFEAFDMENVFDQGQRSLHFLTMLLRRCDSAVKDRHRLTMQVNRLVEEKSKLLADNAKLLASHGSALAAEKKKNEESARRVASIEKQRDSLEFRLKNYKTDFEVAKTEIGVRAIDLFKHSLAFKAFTHREIMRGKAEEDLKKQLTRWESDRERKRMPLLKVHTNLEARVDQFFRSSFPGNLWFDPLIDYGPDFKDEDFYEEENQTDEGCEDEDLGEEEETSAGDFRGDTASGDLGGPEKYGKDGDDN
ncbi:hypothetical protein LWI29_004102 [Acer saccharum]|uniref:Uncharacterized protein n=1 Tax=Acer saccharum TaxID=4024 RepID=A0AA39SL98_ACESA|nr:hypothetical protein LWI29_004102 [Acer saccharum]